MVADILYSTGAHISSDVLTAELIYRFFDKTGNAGAGPFPERNLSYHVGDEASLVLHNRRWLKQDMGALRLVSARQIHSDRIYVDEGKGQGDIEVDGYDALVTQNVDTALLIQQADCQAVLLHDPVNQVIAAIHCGWRGSVMGVIGKTVACLVQRFQSEPVQVRAYIGPSLGPCCAEFVHYRTELPLSFHVHQVRPNYFDFWKISTQQLLHAGIAEEKIVISKMCTCCSPAYFSYRRACRESQGKTGRQGSAICLCSRPPGVRHETVDYRG